MNTITAQTVDRLAEINAQMDALEKEAKALKAELIAYGLPKIDGTQHRATISQQEGRILTDWRAIAERLQPSHQLIAAHTKQGQGFAVVRLFSL